MNLRFLQTVKAVAQYGSLNAAAEQLGLSHSAVSLQIKSLEEELQFQILDRSNRPPNLTGEGQVLVEHALRLEDIANDIRAISDDRFMHGRVRIGAAPSLVATIIAPTLALLHRNQPGLEVEMVSALSPVLIKSVMEGSLHAAIVTDPGGHDPNLDRVPVAVEKHRLITSENELLSNPKEILLQRPFVWFNRQTRLSRDIELFLARRDIAVQSTMEVDSFEGVEALVRHNLGVSILPSRALSAPPQGIKRHDLDSPDLTRRIVIASRKNAPRKRLVPLLNQFITSLFGDQTEKL